MLQRRSRTRRARCVVAAICALAAGCVDNATPLADDPNANAPLCLPDLDGAIEAHELRGVAGAAARYLVATAPALGDAVEIDGTIDAAGRRVWDWRAQTAGEHVAVQLQLAADGWWATEVPAAAFALPIDASGASLGLYHQDDAGLWLHAVVSATPNPTKGRTLLRYATPVPVVRTPLRAGDHWQITVATQGELDGLPWQGSDTWSMRVDGHGRLELPDLAAGPVLRVRTDVEVRSVLGPTARRVQWSWMFECLGELGRVVADGDGVVQARWLWRP